MYFVILRLVLQVHIFSYREHLRVIWQKSTYINSYLSNVNRLFWLIFIYFIWYSNTLSIDKNWYDFLKNKVKSCLFHSPL